MTEIQHFIDSPVVREAAGEMAGFTQLAKLPTDRLDQQYTIEKNLEKRLSVLSLPDDIATAMVIQGWCAVCKKTTDFAFDWTDGEGANWREGLRCSHCHLINRWRSAAQVSLNTINLADPEHSVYLTERLTPLYGWFEQHVPNLVGSEFCSDSTLPGLTSHYGETPYRHEDVTQLSFADNSHSSILSFDVIEHVPDYLAALAEFFRCLRPAGTLILSAPFDMHRERTLVRARLTANGGIEHLMDPEYHGDPVNAQGILSFYTFGWQLLEDLRDCGFCDVQLQLIWNPSMGYLGLGQCFISGQKPPHA